MDENSRFIDDSRVVEDFVEIARQSPYLATTPVVSAVDILQWPGL
jgi:hypothetical protein